MEEPLVSVIILNLNGKKHLKECLSSLFKQDYKNMEIIVVDNGSTDGSVDFIKKNFCQVKLIENKRNIGFTKGNNQGAQKATGKYLLFLNNDIKVKKNFLFPLVETLENDKTIGAAQSKMLSWGKSKVIDSVGCYFTWLGFFWHEAYGEKEKSRFKNLREIFGATGAAFFISKTLFKEIGGFDETFFIYFEDIDLSWRVWRRGKRVVLVPQSVVYHKHGATASRNLPSSFCVFHTFKNSLYILLKDLSLGYLIFIFPFYLFVSLAGGFLFLFRLKPANFLAAYQGILWNVINLSLVMKRRKKARKTIIFSDSEIFSKTARKPPPSYFFNWPRDYLKIWG